MLYTLYFYIVKCDAYNIERNSEALKSILQAICISLQEAFAEKHLQERKSCDTI